MAVLLYLVRLRPGARWEGMAEPAPPPDTAIMGRWHIRDPDHGRRRRHWGYRGSPTRCGAELSGANDLNAFTNRPARWALLWQSTTPPPHELRCRNCFR